MRTLLLSVLFILSVSSSFCQPGSLDKGFGNDGSVISSNPDGQNNYIASSVLRDNRIVVASFIFGIRQGILLSRYLPDGKIDPSFGETGNILISDVQSAVCMITQPDSKIIVGGSVNNGKLTLRRFTSDGYPDSSFAENGVYTDTSTKRQNANGIVINEDGKIIICGYDYPLDGPEGAIYSLVARFNANGSPDLSFGNNGQAIYNTTFFLPSAIALQNNGKIVLGGDEQKQFALLRYNADGTLDKSFGNNGETVTNFDKRDDFINDIAIQGDGKIVAVGAGIDNPSNNADRPYMAVARYNADGSLDNNFNTEGKAKVYVGVSSQAFSVALQKNGKILVAGRSASVNNFSYSLARLLDNGILDSAFGTNGITTTEFENSTFSEVHDLGLQSDGKIITGGSTVDANNVNSTLLARYYGDPLKQPGPITKKIRRWILNHTLNWQDLGNGSVSYYSISQSNNISGFKEIARIKAGISDTYSYNLSNIPSNSSKNFYRITAEEVNGTNVVSDVVADENLTTISISPNPVKDVVKISGLPVTQNSTINIINRNGNVLLSAITQSSTYSYNIQNLNAGVYYVQVIANNKTESIQFIKQ